MGKKKVLTMATEEYVKELLGNIKLIEGKSAYQLAVENGFDGTKEEWLASLKGEKGDTGIFDMEKLYELLNTNDKSVLGAINELHMMINKWMNPVYNIKSQMYFGVINPAEVGRVSSYADITLDMLENSTGIISTKPGERNRLNVGHINEGCLLVIAVPTIFDLEVTKDNGFGGQMQFDESFLGANGIDVELDGSDYRLYGEFILVGGERIINIEQGEGLMNGGCLCEDLTIDDINDVISDVFDSEE